MGKLVMEKWQCDRCKAIFDEKPPYIINSTLYTVHVNVDYGTAGGPLIRWDEMCDNCNREVGDRIEMLNPFKVGK